MSGLGEIGGVRGLDKIFAQDEARFPSKTAKGGAAEFIRAVGKIKTGSSTVNPVKGLWNYLLEINVIA
jgi:hypothetical protein